MRLADGYASTDRTDANANFIRANAGVAMAIVIAAANKNFLIFYPPVCTFEKCEVVSFVPPVDRPISAGGAELGQWLRTRQEPSLSSGQQARTAGR